MKNLIIVLSSVFLISTSFTGKPSDVIFDFSGTTASTTNNLVYNLTPDEGQVIKWKGILFRHAPLKKGNLRFGPWWTLEGLTWVENSKGEWSATATHANLPPGVYEYRINGSYGEPGNSLSSIPLWSPPVILTIY